MDGQNIDTRRAPERDSTSRLKGDVTKLSAGLLAHRTTGEGVLEVLVVHPGGPFWKNKDLHAWSIPKGECEEGADPEAEAAREFEEELGVPAPDGLHIDLGTIRQSSGKQVHAWAVQADQLVIDEVKSNEFEMEWPPKSGRLQRFPEVDRAEWMTVDEARQHLVKAQGAFLDRLVEALSAADT
jgi:predicted NUDIX family NTP pyrophosphohydrolase